MSSQRRSEAPDVDALFEALRSGGDPGARSKLIEQHLPFARRLAARYRYSPQPLEDLEQVASLALVKAVDAYDPARGSSFAAFAAPTILGELKRHMRDASWDVHVPRALKERVAAIEAAERVLAARQRAAPTVAELAAESGFSSEQVLEALGARLAHDAVALEPPQAPDGEAGAAIAPSALVGDDFGDAAADRVALAHALRRLPARERTILLLRFADGLTQTEIAERVGLSQMYVSRLLRATLERLRNEIS